MAIGREEDAILERRTANVSWPVGGRTPAERRSSSVRWQPLRAGFPAPGQKLRDTFDRMIGDARQHIAQIGLGIEVEHLAGFNNRKHGGRPLSARVGAEEDKIVACRRNWP